MMFNPQDDDTIGEVTITLSPDEAALLRRLRDLLRRHKDEGDGADADVIDRMLAYATEPIPLGEKGLGAKILDLLIDGLNLLDQDELKDTRPLADAIAAKMVLAYGECASSSVPLSEAERKNIYRAEFGQPVVFARLAADQARVAAAEALAFAAIIDLDVMVADKMVENSGNYSATDFAVDELARMEAPILAFVDSNTGGRPNKRAGYIKIENAGSFLVHYEAALPVDDASEPRDALNAVGLRTALVSLGQECRAARQEWRKLFELPSYARYIARTVRAGSELRETLGDLVRSDPSTPLKLALSQALAADSLAEGLGAEVAATTNEYFHDFFEILSAGAAGVDRAAVAESLDRFYERLLGARPRISR